MHGTETSIGTARRLSGSLGEPALDPAWRPWVRLLDLALAAAGEPGWASSVVLAPERPPDAPLLHGATLRVDARRFRQLVRALLREADRAVPPEPGLVSRASSGRTAHDSRAAGPDTPRRLDSSGLARAAVSQDASAVERVADAAGVDGARMSAVAQLAILPFVSSCAARFHHEIPAAWPRGYCPVCGAWPALAETRGLDRTRRLRCGRCASDWVIPVLRCPYCDEMNHGALHALVPDGDEHMRRVDVCDTCKGYVKTFATLQAFSARSVATMDLATVELDLMAQDRGYARPSRLAYPMTVTSR